MGCFCGKQLEDPNFEGKWIGDTAEWKFRSNGRVKAKINGEKFSGVVVQWWENEDRTEGFTVATCLGCCSTRKYQINVHPREDSGQWHMNLKHRKYVTTSRWRMKIDGVQLCKVTKEDK